VAQVELGESLGPSGARRIGMGKLARAGGSICPTGGPRKQRTLVEGPVGMSAAMLKITVGRLWQVLLRDRRATLKRRSFRRSGREVVRAVVLARIAIAAGPIARGMSATGPERVAFLADGRRGRRGWPSARPECRQTGAQPIALAFAQIDQREGQIVIVDFEPSPRRLGTSSGAVAAIRVATSRQWSNFARDDALGFLGDDRRAFRRCLQCVVRAAGCREVW